MLLTKKNPTNLEILRGTKETFPTHYQKPHTVTVTYMKKLNQEVITQKIYMQIISPDFHSILRNFFNHNFIEIPKQIHEETDSL